MPPCPTTFIQPHGALLVLAEPDLVVVQASANAAGLLGLAGPLLGRPVADIPGGLAARLRPCLRDRLAHPVPLAAGCAVGQAGDLFDVTLHRATGGGLVVELEPAAIPVDRARQMVDAVEVILDASTLPSLCDVAVRLMRDVTGYDHVAIRRGDGAEAGPEAGPHATVPWPADPGGHDQLRLMVDVGHAPVPVLPVISPLTGEPLDMSRCLLRGTAAAGAPGATGAMLVVPLVVGGRSWGTIVCRHALPRPVPLHVRVVCELLAEAVATRIAALESVRRGQAEHAVRRLEQGLRDAIREDGDWRGALFGNGQRLLEPVRATGAALLMDGQVLTVGRTPDRPDMHRIAAWLDGRAGGTTFATPSLGGDDPAFAGLPILAGGLAAVRLSPLPGEYLIWFRPDAPCSGVVVPGAGPHPFARSHAECGPAAGSWTEADLDAARLIGETIKDIALQFRSVSIVIAHQQLERTRRQVSRADAPLLVAGADGSILMTSDALRSAIGDARPPDRLGELPDLFTDGEDCRRRLRDLCEHGLAWRGRVRLRADGRPLLVRADPVLSAPGQVSGYVLLLSDITEQESAEAAQRSFRESVGALESLGAGRRGARPGPAMQDVLATVIENARLAALEIADGVDPARMPEMLRSVTASVARARRAIDQLGCAGDAASPVPRASCMREPSIQAGSVH